jgi:hypothetical protein
LDEFDAFDTYRDKVYLDDGLDLPQVNTIVWWKKYEGFFLRPFHSRGPDSRNDACVSDTSESGMNVDEEGLSNQTSECQNVGNLEPGLEESAIQPATTEALDSQHSLDMSNDASAVGSLPRKTGIVKSVYRWLLTARRTTAQALRKLPT